MTDMVREWIEAVAPGYGAVADSLPPLKRGAYPWVKHTGETAALCRRITNHTNRELRAYGCKSVDSSPCGEACRVCVLLCKEHA